MTHPATAADEARVQDAYGLCRRLYADICRCEVRRGTPCEVIQDMIDMDQDVGVELRRMARGMRAGV